MAMEAAGLVNWPQALIQQRSTTMPRQHYPLNSLHPLRAYIIHKQMENQHPVGIITLVQFLRSDILLDSPRASLQHKCFLNTSAGCRFSLLYGIS